MKSISRHIIIAILALTCLPTVICAQYLWRSSSFGPISLTSISSQTDIREGSATIILDVNGTVMEAEITAENGPDAQLHNATDTLVTEYKLEFDGDGSSETGGSNTSYESYETFLTTPAAITYRPGDNDVAVTLWVRASNIADNVADSGLYTATQTLTVTWAGN